MKASKRVENLLPSGILVVGLAAMALFGVGFSAFQTSNTMSPIENSIDVEVGSIIEGGKAVLEMEIKGSGWFDGNGDINLSVVINGLIGDSYVNLNQYADAHKYFAKAYETNNEAFAALYLKKDGEVYETEKNFDKAIELYNKIKNEFPQSGEAQDIEKYIERATLSK